jgi:hypothetical protein
MPSATLHASRTALIACWLLWGPSALAQPEPVWLDPPGGPDETTQPEPSEPVDIVEPPLTTDWARTGATASAQAARHFAFTYLASWSAPNQVTLASASSFYGPTVKYHGRMRTRGSVLAEKRQFAQRWPDRTYRYRPETTQVACETSEARCTVRSIFDFAAANSRQGRRSRGIGDHELVVSFASGNPVIASETSRVLRRGLTRFSATMESH